MARFSPRDPGFTRVPTLAEGLGTLAQSAGAAQEDARDRRIEDELLEEEELERTLDRFERGFTDRPRREPVPEDEDVFRGAGIGLQRTEAEDPGIFRDARPGMAADAPGITRPGRQPSPLAQGLGTMAQERGPIQTQEQEDVLSIPGAFVEGLGFTPRAIRSSDLVEQNRARAQAIAGPRERLAPGVEQVSEGMFFDPEQTREGRQARQDTSRSTERQARLTAVLGAIQRGDEDISPEILAEALELGVPQHMLRGEGANGEIRVQGRDFPNTPAGERAALAWREAVAEAGRTGGAGGSAERITGEVTRRTLATAAARALDGIRQDVRELTDYERRNLQAGQIQRQIQETLTLFGFESAEELQREMRELRLAGTGGAPPGGDGDGGGGVEISDELIDRVMQENPDASEEELMDLVLAASRGG